MKDDAMNMKAHDIVTMHDKIEEYRQAYKAAVNKNMDYQLMKKIKTAIGSLKKKLKEMKNSFHDEFKNCQ